VDEDSSPTKKTHRKINPKTMAHFSALKNRRLSHQLHHAKHHNFTIKHHAENTAFPKATLKNAQKRRKKAPAAAGAFFLNQIQKTKR
jgi:hypothetical protein